MADLDDPELTTAAPPSVVSKAFDFVLYLWSLASPYVTPTAIVLFLLPVFLCVFIYATAFVFYLHQRHPGRIWRRLRKAVLEDHDILDAGRDIVATLWDVQGWIWFGYEVKGLENVPADGGALILYYHGALPIDYYYFVAKVILNKQRVVHSVVDHFLFQVPGLRNLLSAFHCTPGSVDGCVDELGKGHLLGLSPGGVYEAQFGDSNYEVMWKSRTGFAKIALAAKCPVIPMFTENVRESFRAVTLFRPFFKWVYNLTKLPCAPLYGGFPVKLTTYVGEPIEYDPDNCGPEELRDLCRSALEKMIAEKQGNRPGSIWRAFLQRFRKSHLS